MQAAVMRLSGEPAPLPDARLRRRLRHLIVALAAQAEMTLARALDGWAARKAAYRFFANPRVTPEAILAAERPACLDRVVAVPTVLIVQDTTDADFTDHPRVRGLGPLPTPHGTAHRGFKVHSALAVAAATGVPLGLLAQQLWCRDPATVGSRRTKRKRPTAAKESGRWLAVEQASLAGIPASTQVVTVADREGDIFAWFAAPRPAHAHLLVRAAQLRRNVADERALWDAVAPTPCRGHYQVAVAEAPGRTARTAVCSVRVAAVALRQPVNLPAGTPRQAPVPVWVVLAQEETPPADGGAPLCWVLLSTLPVQDVADACRCLYWYTLRWLVERYHFVLKSGCQLEHLQLQTAERLLRAAAVCCLVAVQVLALTYLPREQPELPCSVALSRDEWQTLVALRPALATPTGEPPALAAAMQALAQWGGHLGRRRDGPPGALTLWRGLQRLKDAAVGWRLARNSPPVTGCG